MLRHLLTTTIAASLLVAPAFGADIFGGKGDADFLRDSYSSEWDMSDNGDPLDFEMGIRYYYSLGSSKLTVNGDEYSSEDKSSIVEIHARIDDNSTDTFLRGSAGYSASISGTYESPERAGTQDINGGSIAYAGADFGYMPLGSSEFRLGGFVGYQFLRDNPDMGRSNYVNVNGGGGSRKNEFDINALRLGVVARADLGDMVDLNLEAAVIPYAHLGGTFGAFSLPNYLVGGTTYVQGSEGEISGNLYGASGEAMLGFHPTDEITIRVGGRVTYLTGNATMSYTARDIAGPTPVDPLDPLGPQVPADSQRFISDISGLELFRYGALIELTGRF